jgi:carboxylesterase type B
MNTKNMENNIFLLSLIALTFAQNFNLINCVTIKTKSGSVNGVAVTFDNKVINKFLGIPYAEPPVGSNRFAQTKPVHAWNGTYDATHFKNVCYQKASGFKMSEDCLYLNIYSEERKSGDNKLRPVMFWIHGGGFTDGDGYGFDGTVLSSKGVVFVSINYRLGPFGFLYGGDSSAPGNVGILDQIMALHWVKDNIEAFGGDPNQVTIFGFSAGGLSVSTLIVSPLAKNLFKRAIIQSGAYFAKPILDSNKDNHLANAKKMSESIGCAHDNKWLDCLRNASADLIIKNISANTLTYGGESGVVPNGIEEALKLKKVNTGITHLTFFSLQMKIFLLFSQN